MTSDTGESAWRPAFAALSNAAALRLYAQIVLQEDEPGSDLSPSRRRHAIASLSRAGLIEDDDGHYVASEDSFSHVLRHAPRAAPRVGVDRFLTRDGRIDRYPASAADRLLLLQHVAVQVLAPGEVLGEAELNDRLERFDEDVAALRRYLVDHELLERSADGSRYARPASG